MINFRRPMLAASLLPSKVEHTDENILEAMKKLRYPVFVTEKKDGIRALKVSTNLVSRTLKPIPNSSIRIRSYSLPTGYDMELFNAELKYEQIESIVMSREHKDSDLVQFHVLDNFNIEGATYEQRIWSINKDINCWSDCPFVFEYPTAYTTPERLFDIFLDTEQSGGEGICFRTPNSHYKQGRSTLKEQYLVKLCRNLTSEAVIEGFEEQMENGNVEQRNAIGAMDRSSCKANLYGKDTLGSLIVRDLKSGLVFNIGTGFNDAMRFNIWHEQSNTKGKIITYKYKGGGKDLPRCPVFMRFRSIQ